MTRTYTQLEQINFTRNLVQAGNSTVILLLKKQKKLFLNQKIKYQYKMTQCNSLNAKLSNWLPNKLKSATKNETEV